MRGIDRRLIEVIHWPMSALGQKQTYTVQQPISALLPIATAKADIRRRASMVICLPPGRGRVKKSGAVETRRAAVASFC
jgi:hypothetical protein